MFTELMAGMYMPVYGVFEPFQEYVFYVPLVKDTVSLETDLSEINISYQICFHNQAKQNMC